MPHQGCHIPFMVRIGDKALSVDDNWLAGQVTALPSIASGVALTIADDSSSFASVRSCRLAGYKVLCNFAIVASHWQCLSQDDYYLALRSGSREHRLLYLQSRRRQKCSILPRRYRYPGN